MDYSLTTLFVLPKGSALPATGSTDALTEDQFGAFINDDRTIATTGNVGAASYLQFAQGRPSTGYGSKRSDKIVKTKIKDFYKIVGTGTGAAEVWTVSNITVPVDQAFTLSLRAHSFYLDALSFNGFLKSYTIPAGCLTCGSDPCADAVAEDIVDALIAKYNDDANMNPNGFNIPAFFTFAKTGTGAAASLVITAKLFDTAGQPCDLAANPFHYDRMSFQPMAYLGAATTSDAETNTCPVPATLTLTTRSTFPIGTPDAIRQLEKDYHAYQSPYKQLFGMPGFNPDFKSNVDDTVIYNQYVLIFDEAYQTNSWVDNIKEDEAVIIAVEQGSAIETALIPIITAFYQAPADKTVGTVAAPYFP